MTSLLIFQLQAKTFVVVYTLHAANKFLMASDLQPTLQLKDVYDIAQSVGEAFQLLIKRFGDSSFVDLVNTVVNVLEHLETYVQDNQKLQAQLCKLLLDNDKLLKENETLRTESQKNTATLASMEVVRMEKLQLAMQLENARGENRELMKQIEGIQSRTHMNGKQDSLDEDHALENSDDPLRRKSLEELQEKSDAMEIPRMKRRLAQTENELKRTRTKLLSAQSTLKCIVSENNVLKAQVEESKAEIGLKTLQLSSGSHYAANPESSSPKFYKKDLLVVLRERNELKEQLDALRDELTMTRLQMRYHYQAAAPEDNTGGNTENAEGRGPRLQKTRATTTVRDIVTSMTTEINQERKSGQKQKYFRKPVT